MKFRQELKRAMDDANAMGIQRLSEHVAATWWNPVKRLRSDWLGDIKSAGQYVETFDRLVAQAKTTDPVALLAFAAQKTGSPASLRLYRAAIKHVASQEQRDALQAVLREADREADKARKVAKDNPLKGSLATCCSGLVYEEKLGPIVVKLDALAKACEQAKALKPTGRRAEPSHSQRGKLGRVADDWQDRMLDRMSRGVGGRPGKQSAAAAVTVLTGLRPAELQGCQCMQSAGKLGIVIEGAKVDVVKVPQIDPRTGVNRSIDASRGRDKRYLVFEVAKLTGAALKAALILREQAPANGQMWSIQDAAGFGSAWRAAARREFGQKMAKPSAYANRHQFASEMKARIDATDPTDANAVEVARCQFADAMGHASTRAQGGYGWARRSRLKGMSGLVKIEAAGEARVARSPSPPSKVKTMVKRVGIAKAKSGISSNPAAPRPRL